jgi:hypothetical protein
MKPIHNPTTQNQFISQQARYKEQAHDLRVNRQQSHLDIQRLARSHTHILQQRHTIKHRSPPLRVNRQQSHLDIQRLARSHTHILQQRHTIAHRSSHFHSERRQNENESLHHYHSDVTE